MITGEDYVFYSSISFFDISDSFFKLLNSKWSSPIVETFDIKENEYIELFIAKDELMNSYHEKYGFNLKYHNQGCFMIYSRKINYINLDIIVKEQFHVGSKMKTEAYDSKLIANDLWQTTFVLPGEAENNNFCEFILNSFLDLL